MDINTSGDNKIGKSDIKSYQNCDWGNLNFFEEKLGKRIAILRRQW